MLPIRCPICDAQVETILPRKGAEVRCAVCGHSFAAENQAMNRIEKGGRSPGGSWTVHVAAFPGRHVRRRMQGLALRKSGRRASHVAKERRRWLPGSEWRKIGIGLIAFLGMPAAIIFFLVVVCAPRGH